uniref:Small ribosomal subunit protein uS2c n=1 Tax=Xylochloris irregularis TaxID=480381 RepID=A0A097KME1_9CHLO|nr:ribosomal protein S2 [Xylochloris irregularis]AIT94348.1 ribosomal protein S2 [Xylochloris irregularis]
MFGVKMHLGHQAQSWHPKMRPYIRGKRENFHVINLVKTLFCLQEASRCLFQATSTGKEVLFVGTQKQASGCIEKAARYCDSSFVNQKWLGGTLTNWQKIKKSLARLNHLQGFEQKGLLQKMSKKEIASYNREKQRLEKHLGGLKGMLQIPDVVVIVGQPYEFNAVRECQKLGIKTITVVDTDCNPDLADFVIPSNDDSMKSISLVLAQLVLAVRRGQLSFAEKMKKLLLKKGRLTKSRKNRAKAKAQHRANKRRRVTAPAI